ncbi:MAG: SRPBCC domain-containing protein [Candidatus Eremiobacteraeota bacterium]|mgnify:FL=1|nr:SRPBCC domain-containing protein [Candidatus Eremiobacteraeota bacterium]
MWLEESPIIRKSIETTAYPEQIWEALTDTELLGQWMADSASGWLAVGGSLSLTWERFGMTIEYKVAEVKVCQRLILKCPMGSGQQTVTFGLRRAGRSTWVDITDAPAPFTPHNPHSSADSNWGLSMSVLKLYVERYYRKPRRSFMAVAKASFTFGEIMALYATAEGLEHWLAEKIVEWPAEEPFVGKPYRLVSKSGDVMSGYIMAVTDKEASLSWNEINGFLELKTFSLGPGNQMLCLRGSGYGMDEETASLVEEGLKPRLLQLVDYLES